MQLAWIMRLCNYAVMNEIAIKAASLRARRLAAGLGLDQMSIENATGVSQSQVSRVLAGKLKRRTTAFDSVCNYVHRKAGLVSPRDVRQCATLIDALAAVWDGSETHAAALATVIQSLGVLAPPAMERRSRDGR
jgi:predicted transcriptional regulator